MYKPVIFREYDIRGVYQKQFDLDFAEVLGQAVVTYIIKKQGKPSPKLTIGHDARLSSPEIVKALSRGMRKSGGHVVLLGLVTTPMDYFSTFELPNIDGSIMVTGSHNPPEYNGFKVSVGKTTIFGPEIQALEKIVASRDFPTGAGTETSEDIFPAYVARYKKEFGDLGNVPVVLDCGNGAGGIVARKLYEAVGLKPKILFEQPDGRFPNHHPDPTVKENLRFLSEEVRKTKSIVGIGFDGDADRIGIVDEKGDMIYGDELIALCARFILEKQKGAPIIGDVKCSDRMYDYIQKYGGKPVMWMTGHSLIKEKIKVDHAPFGGELSGHIFFADRNYGYDDALYAGLRVIEILAKTKKTIREILSDLPPAFNTPEIRIDTTEEKKVSIVAALKKKYSAATNSGLKLNLIDGIRISFADGWALARASNTQPVLVLRFESSTEAGLKRISDEINSVVTPLL
jgi:phosphomannomutase / phosphoglucomutase